MGFEKIEDFLRDKYFSDILKSVKEDKSVTIDFEVFDRYDPITADMMLEDPDLVMKSLNEAAESMAGEKIRVRVRNLPESRQIRIRNLRAKHIGKFLQIDATIRSATEVRPQIYEAIFQCPDCSANIVVLQESTLLQKPTVCECGRRGDFPLTKENLLDTRWLTGIEPFEVTSGEQPGEITIFLKEDLTTPKMQRRTDPGSSLRITGVLKQLPKRIKGRLTTKMDIYIEANHIEHREVEFEELEITPEDELAIKKLASDPDIYEKLKLSIAPGIYGFDEIKEAVALQMFGGIQHTMPDGSKIRGNIHMLLTGDPGCLIGDERVVMGNGAIEKIKNLGSHHLQKINANVLTGEGGRARDKASVFHFYKSQNVMEIITESGKSIKGTYNHPLLVLHNGNGNIKREWKRLDELKIGDRLAVVTSIPCTITKHIETDFKGALPKYATEDFGAFIGYVIGDGWIKNKYEIGFVVAESELDILEKLVNISKSLFSINPHLKVVRPKNGIINGRTFRRKAEMTYVSICSKDIASNLDFLKIKRVPDIIFKSGNSVASSFLKWLFEADGCVFNRGRGNRSISLKAEDIELLRDVQILLLRFSIHARIVGDNLMIRRGESMLKFAKHIGFVSDKKTAKLKHLVLSAEQFRGQQRSERIVKIIKHKPEDVYDIEVPKSHRFIANGIVSHNTGKTVMLKLVSSVMPRGKYVSGSGVTGAGLCTTGDTLVQLGDGRIVEIGKLVEEKLMNNCKREGDNIWTSEGNDLEVPALCKDIKIRNKKITKYWKLRSPKNLMKITTRSGRSIKVTLENPIPLIENGTLVWKAAKDAKLSKKIIVPKLKDGLATSDILWDEIKNLEIVDGEEYVYDLTVEGEHSFVANGMIIHNTASVRKDEVIGAWVLEAGALILANKSVISIDEFDKMSKDDQIAMHEAMSVETISIAKASIVATLPAQTAVLAGANPQYGRFDTYKSVAEQIQIPETLLSRFDLKFALIDKPDKIADERLADHIIMSRITPYKILPVIDVHFLRKYIAYAKQHVKELVLIPEAADALKKFYIEMRSPGGAGGPIGITLRQYEALLRLAEASAKVRLDTHVRNEDAARAIRLMTYSLRQLGFDTESGMIDIDKMEGGLTTSKRKRITRLVEIVERMQKESKEVAILDVFAEAQTLGISEKDAEETMEELVRKGELFHPKPGFVKKV